MVDLHIGGRAVMKQYRHLDWTGCNRVEFRVVGNNTVGWAEAVPLWRGSLNTVDHFGQNNHFYHSVLNLPQSISVQEGLNLWCILIVIEIETLNLPRDSGNIPASKLFIKFRP